MLYLDAQDSLNLKNEIYEPIETVLIKFLLKPTDVCLDIGAHIGYFTVLMAPLCKKVYAFEPDPKNYALLRKNTDCFDNVEAMDIAIAESGSFGMLYRCPRNSGMHRIYPSKHCNSEGSIINAAYLDLYFYVKENPVHFVKMDIEGAEFGALKGMKEMLTLNHPTMIMEFHPESIEEYGANPKEEYDFIKGLGYDIRLIPNISISISYEELEKETRKKPARNVLCLKNDEHIF